MDRLEAMSILVAAVESGSLTAASRRLGAPLPTVSRKISDLEAHLNAQLLIRSTRKLTLTDAGAAYIGACKRILEQVEDAERAASGEYSAPKGDLMVTAPIVFGRLHVLPAIVGFLARFPEIDVRLTLSDRNAHLIDDHIDIAVRIGALPDSSLIATRLGFVRRVVCASSGYLSGRGVPQAPNDLSAHDCVTFDRVAPATWSFAGADSRKGGQVVPIRSRLAVNTAEAAIDAAIAGGRRHARSVVSSRAGGCRGQAANRARRFRARAAAYQYPACRAGALAAQDPRLSRFRRAGHPEPPYD